jgi:ABC-type transport system involved in cytochrome c biogenesis permease subunit
MAYVAFFLACWYAFLYAMGNEEAGFFHSYIIAAFVLFSLSQVVGAVWSYLGWAVPFHISSDRHLISAAFWLFLALYLHLKLLSGWTAGRRAKLIVFSFFAVFYFRYVPYFLSNLKK